jgi:hypothetical protein
MAPTVFISVNARDTYLESLALKYTGFKRTGNITDMDLNLHLSERKRLPLERFYDRREGGEFRPFDIDLLVSTLE